MHQPTCYFCGEKISSDELVVGIVKVTRHLTRTKPDYSEEEEEEEIREDRPFHEECWGRYKHLSTSSGGCLEVIAFSVVLFIILSMLCVVSSISIYR